MDLVNCEIEYYKNWSTSAGFGNMNILVDLDKNHFDAKVEISKLGRVKECVRNEEVEVRDTVNLWEKFFGEIG